MADCLTPKSIFNAVIVPDQCDDNCIYLIKTSRMYEVKDSPDCVECACTNPHECPVVNDVLINSDSWSEDEDE